MDCSFKASFTGLRIEPTTVVFQASLLWSVQLYKTTGTHLSAQVIDRSNRKEIPITNSTPPLQFTWLILTVWLCLSELLKGQLSALSPFHRHTHPTAHILMCRTLTDNITLTDTHPGKVVFPGWSYSCCRGKSIMLTLVFHFRLFYLAVNMSCISTFPGHGCVVYLVTYRLTHMHLFN